MTLAQWALLLLAACASEPVVGERRGAIAAGKMDSFLSLAWTAESYQSDSYFGGSVSSAGDVNGDEYDDVVVGANRYDNGSTGEGRAYMYLGSAAGLHPTAAWTAESDQSGADFGNSVSSAGDVNGDGYGDVIVGAVLYGDPEDNEGRAYVYLGSAAGLDPAAAWTAESDQQYAVFGQSVSSAGDVNGDGYGDVIVGAHGYGDPEDNEGRAYVYLGSVVGLDPTAVWAAESDQTDAQFGYSVSSAGDVNDDGYGDVVVGGWLYDNGSADEGRAFVYLGSAAGLDPIEAWTAESDEKYAYFGVSVSSAGDVNGDGYGDVVVGASWYDNGSNQEGGAFLYLGSAAGLDPSAAWTAESDQRNAYFGGSVSSAGDVNGDGYGDVVVGAILYDDGSTNEGRAYVYLGSAAGLDPTAAWTAESDQTEAWLGGSVSSAWDVNGDGYDDVIVGAPAYDNGTPDEGAAFLYEGSCYDTVDSDADRIGDACDSCPGFDDALDADLDGVPDDCDFCPTDADPGNTPDADDDGFCAEDCDDADSSIHPGAPELCDEVDNDCDGLLPPDEVDVDGDAWLDCADCDDQDATRFPGAEELCNDLDDDCDGAVGPNEIDADGDLYSPCDGDCDDTETRANSHLIELCGDAIDNDCDGVVDEDCAHAPDTGCGCSGAGGPGAPSLIALAVLLWAAQRPTRTRARRRVEAGR